MKPRLILAAIKTDCVSDCPEMQTRFQTRGARISTELHATIIYTPNAARLVGQHRLEGGPFIVAEFVPHDSRLRFRSLNHFPASAINPQLPVAMPLMF